MAFSGSASMPCCNYGCRSTPDRGCWPWPAQLRAEANVLGVFLVGGDRDLVVHVVCESTDDLRDFVNEKIGTNPDLASSATNLVFEEL